MTYLEIGYGELALGAVLLLVDLALSVALRLGLTRDLAVMIAALAVCPSKCRDRPCITCASDGRI